MTAPQRRFNDTRTTGGPRFGLVLTLITALAASWGAAELIFG